MILQETGRQRRVAMKQGRVRNTRRRKGEMEFCAFTHPPTSHHHHGERLIRNFGARVPRGNVLFGFPRATISFPPMQACQRRTIGGGGGNGGGGEGGSGSDGDRGEEGWFTQLRLHPPPLLSPFLFLAVPHYPTHPLRMGLIPFSVCRDCTAWGQYWGAYGSARGGAPLILCLLVPLFSSPPSSLSSLSIFLSVSPPLRESTVLSFVCAHLVCFCLSRSIDSTS